MFSYMLSNRPIVNSGVSNLDARMIAEESSRPLEMRIDALELTCAALWTLLKHHHGYTDDELVRAIHDATPAMAPLTGKSPTRQSNAPTATPPDAHRAAAISLLLGND